MTGRISVNAALIIIDVQNAWNDPSWGKRNNPDAEARISRMLKSWRDSARPVFHVRHDSLNPNSLLRHGKRGFEFKSEARPIGDEPVITKNVNSAFIGTDLEKKLRDAGIHEVFICGLTSDHCVSTSARMAGNLGFSTFVIADACATHERIDHTGRKISPEEVHYVNLASLNGEFATIVSSEEVLSNIGPS